MAALLTVSNNEHVWASGILTNRVISSRQPAAVDGEVERNGCFDLVILCQCTTGCDERGCDEEGDCGDAFHDDLLLRNVLSSSWGSGILSLRELVVTRRDIACAWP